MTDKHGSATVRCGNMLAGCQRCDECRSAALRVRRLRVAWRRELLADNPGLRPHGDTTTYNEWGCRCTPCRDASNRLRYSYARSRSSRLSLGNKPHTAMAQPFGREWLDAPT